MIQPADLPSSASPSLRSARFVPPLLLLALAFALFFPLLSFPPLNWDDHETLFQNPDLHPATLGGLGRYWTGPHLSLYIPVTYTFWWGLTFLSPGNEPHAPVFRFASIALHGASAVLVYHIGRQILAAKVAKVAEGRGVAVSAFLAAAYFLVAPTQVESVAWISGQKDLLAGLLALGALSAALRYWAGPDVRVWSVRALLPAGLFALALLAKPGVAALPVGFAALGLAVFPESRRRVLWVTGAMLAASLPVLLVAKLSQPAPDVFVPTLWGRMQVVGFSLAFYLGKLLWPLHLSLDYGHDPRRVLAQPLVMLAPFVALFFIWAALITAWRARRLPRMSITPTLYALATLFLAALLPVLGLVPFEFQDYSTVADHYLYTATLAPALLLALVLHRWWRAVPPCVLLLGLLAARTATYLPVWRDNVALFNHVLKETPTSLAGHRTLAYLASTANDIPSARAHYEAALAARPDDFIANYNLANLLRAAGEPLRAIPHYEAAAARKPADATVRNNLAIALAQAGRPDDAFARFEEAAHLAPNWADPHANAGLLALQLARPDAARRHLQDALTRNPAHPQARAALTKLDANPP